MVKAHWTPLACRTACLLRIAVVCTWCTCASNDGRVKDATFVVTHAEKYQTCPSRLDCGETVVQEGAPCICCETDGRTLRGRAFSDSIWTTIEHQDWYSCRLPDPGETLREWGRGRRLAEKRSSMNGVAMDGLQQIVERDGKEEPGAHATQLQWVRLCRVHFVQHGAGAGHTGQSCNVTGSRCGQRGAFYEHLSQGCVAMQHDDNRDRAVVFRACPPLEGAVASKMHALALENDVHVAQRCGGVSGSVRKSSGSAGFVFAMECETLEGEVARSPKRQELEDAVQLSHCGAQRCRR